ncbi:MAG: glycosyltransferase [Fermentimonas sp.]|nr:glycosyltransferase [Fermentimonas sp.]
MKVLQVNVVYGKGSTGKITEDIHNDLLKNNFDSVVCYGRGARSDDPKVIKTCGESYSKVNNLFSRINGIMYGGCVFSTQRLIREIKKQSPDIVHLQCINGYFVNIYRLVKWLKINHIKTVLTLHAEFMFTGGCGLAIDCNQWHSRQGCGLAICPRWRSETKSLFFDRTGTMWNRMKNAFDGFDDNLVVVSVSPWLMDRAKASPIFKDKRHCVVMNGLNDSVFYPRIADTLHGKYALGDKKIVFHASPAFTDQNGDLKGGFHLIEIAKLLPEFVFVVAGPYHLSSEVPDNVILLGMIKDQNELASYYSEADVTLLVSQKETFSMVTAESLCCGTPVVGFKAGGPESIAIPAYSEFVEYGNYEQVIAAVKKHIETKVDPIVCKNKYAMRVMTEKYVRIYNELHVGAI